MYNVKNYTEPGGEKTVIGGTLEIQKGAEVKGLPSVGGGGSEFPSTFKSYICDELPEEAPIAQVVHAVNDIRRALIQNEMMEGVHQTTFTFQGAQSSSNEILKANKDACTVSFDSTTSVLTIECNPDALKEVKIDLSPYFNYQPHKYVVVAFYLGSIFAEDFGDCQVNCERYYSNAWSALGLTTSFINIPIAVDALKPGMNKNAYFIQHGYYERKYISVNLVTSD